jgi:hypothetical protein
VAVYRTVVQLGQDLRVRARANRCGRDIPSLVDLVLQVGFLNADGTLRCRRPLWLFWSGRPDIELAHPAPMDLLCFVIEHVF